MSFTADVLEWLQWPTLAETGPEGEWKLALRFIEPALVADAGAGVTLVAPRYLYDGGRLLAEAEVVQSRLHRPELLLSRSDAQKLGVGNGDEVTVSQNGTSLA